MRCSICGKEIKGYGNDPFPLSGTKCCDECNMKVVVPYRLFLDSLKKKDVAMLIKQDHVENMKIDRPLTLKEMQKAVEGMIEIVPGPFPGYLFIVNEEGLLKGLPYNELCYKMFNDTEFVGNVMLVHSKWVE